MAVGKNKTWKKGKRGSNIIFPIILKLLGRILSGKGDNKFREENQDFKKWDGEEYQVAGNFIHPWMAEGDVKEEEEFDELSDILVGDRKGKIFYINI